MHPYVSVLPSLDEASRARLVDVLAGLAAGRAEAPGLLEAHGVLLELTAETLALLDLGAAGPDGEPVDVVVRADQLPGRSLAPEARARSRLLAQREALSEEVRRAEAAAHRADVAHAASRSSLDEQPDGRARGDEALEQARVDLQSKVGRRREADRTLAAAVERLAVTRRRYDTAAAALEAAKHERNELARAATAAAADLEAARSDRDPSADGALGAARDRVAELERERASEREEVTVLRAGEAAPHALDSAALTERLADLERARQGLEASLSSLGAADPYNVEVALSGLDGDADSGSPLHSEAALALAEEWAALEERIAAWAPVGPRDPTAIVEARRRLDLARIALFEAERAVRLPDISPEEADALETAHDAVLEAQKRLARRFSGAKARARLDESRHIEQQLLDSLGFLTYTDFVTGTSIGRTDPAKQAILERARQALANAEAEAAALEASVDAELALAELRNEQTVLRVRAVQLLGHDPGDDLEWELRQLRVDRADSSRFDRLRRALASSGVDVGAEDANGELLIELARAWLDEHRATASERERLEAELTAIRAELSAARSRVADAAGQEAGPAVEDRRSIDRLAEARATLRAAELRVERHARAQIAIAQAKVELDRAAAAEERATEALKPLEDAVAEAAKALQRDDRAVREAAEALRAASSAQERSTEEVAAAEARQAQAASLGDRESRERVVAATAAEAEERTAELKQVLAALSELDERIEQLPDPGESDTIAGVSAEEVEWYLLSRVAAQRAVSYAGSVPIVLQDAFGSLPPESLGSLLERLERMASAVQVVIISDDAPIGFWAEQVGPERAAVVRAEPVAPR